MKTNLLKKLSKDKFSLLKGFGFIIILVVSMFLLSCSADKAEVCTGSCILDINGIMEVSVDDAKKLIEENLDNDKFVILDIRTRDEFDSGHIKNSVNIDYYASDFKEKIDALDKSKTYLVYCRSANRSGSSMYLFEDLGFIEVYDMQGGINDWVKKSYSIV